MVSSPRLPSRSWLISRSEGPGRPHGCWGGDPGFLLIPSPHFSAPHCCPLAGLAAETVRVVQTVSHEDRRGRLRRLITHCPLLYCPQKPPYGPKRPLGFPRHALAESTARPRKDHFAASRHRGVHMWCHSISK